MTPETANRLCIAMAQVSTTLREFAFASEAAKKNHGFLEMTPEGVKKLADRVHEWIEVLTAEVTETTRPAERTARPTDTESELHLAALDYSIAVRQQSGYAITIAEQKLKEAARRMSQ